MIYDKICSQEWTSKDFCYHEITLCGKRILTNIGSISNNIGSIVITRKEGESSVWLYAIFGVQMQFQYAILQFQFPIPSKSQYCRWSWKCPMPTIGPCTLCDNIMGTALGSNPGNCLVWLAISNHLYWYFKFKNEISLCMHFLSFMEVYIILN